MTLVHLVGGPKDGMDIDVPLRELRPTIVVPVPDLVEVLQEDPRVAANSTIQIATYRRSAHLNGEYYYRHEG